jgi:hypothetical protein
VPCDVAQTPLLDEFWRVSPLPNGAASLSYVSSSTAVYRDLGRAYFWALLDVSERIVVLSAGKKSLKAAGGNGAKSSGRSLFGPKQHGLTAQFGLVVPMVQPSQSFKGRISDYNIRNN